MLLIKKHGSGTIRLCPCTYGQSWYCSVPQVDLHAFGPDLMLVNLHPFGESESFENNNILALAANVRRPVELAETCSGSKLHSGGGIAFST